MENPATIYSLFRQLKSLYQNRVVLAQRIGEEWETWDVDKFSENVQKTQTVLVKNGVSKGSRVGIMYPSSPRWLMLDFAIQSLGAVGVPLFEEVSAHNLQLELEDAQLSIICVSTNGNNLFEGVFDALMVKTLILADTGDPEGSFDVQFQAAECFSGEHSFPSEDSLITIIYTSGSTGVPKGVALTQKNIASQVEAAGEIFPMSGKEDDIALSCLPLPHVFQRMVTYCYLSKGVPIYFVDDVKKTAELMRDISPTIVAVVPRLLEKVHAKMKAGADSSPFMIRPFIKKALQWAESSDPENAPSNLILKLADKMVFQKFRDALGGKVRYLICGGAALREECNRFLINSGIPVYQGYGCTETSPVIACNYPGYNRSGTVGLPFPSVEVRITDRGEIAARGPGIMKEYVNKPEETTNSIDKEGWYHTGDKGELSDDGFLRITGRFKELAKTSCGKYVSTAHLEQKVASLPHVDLAMVLVHDKPFVGCLVFPDHDVLEQLKLSQPATENMALDDYIMSSEVNALIQSGIDEINITLSKWEQIRVFRIISTPPSVEREEVTPTMKLRHFVLEEHYKDLIEDIYFGDKP